MYSCASRSISYDDADGLSKYAASSASKISPCGSTDFSSSNAKIPLIPWVIFLLLLLNSLYNTPQPSLTAIFTPFDTSVFLPVYKTDTTSSLIISSKFASVLDTKLNLTISIFSLTIGETVPLFSPNLSMSVKSSSLVIMLSAS